MRSVQNPSPLKPGEFQRLMLYVVRFAFQECGVAFPGARTLLYIDMSRPEGQSKFRPVFVGLHRTFFNTLLPYFSDNSGGTNTEEVRLQAYLAGVFERDADDAITSYESNLLNTLLAQSLSKLDQFFEAIQMSPINPLFEQLIYCPLAPADPVPVPEEPIPVPNWDVPTPAPTLEHPGLSPAEVQRVIVMIHDGSERESIIAEMSRTSWETPAGISEQVDLLIRQTDTNVPHTRLDAADQNYVLESFRGGIERASIAESVIADTGGDPVLIHTQITALLEAEIMAEAVAAVAADAVAF